MRRRRLTTSLATLASGAALGLLGVAGYTAWTLNGPRRPWPDYVFTPFEVRADSEDVRLTSADGVGLAGWWLDAPGSDTVVVCAHGHRGNKADMLGIGSGLWREGFSVLLFDFRGNGDSDDGPQSLAHREQADLRAAIDYAVERRPGARVVVMGFSMGASTAILVGAADPRVAAFALDSPFATMGDVVAANYRRYRLPSQPFLPLADLANRLRYGYSYAQVRPLDAIGSLAPRPVLLLHGTDDRVVPCSHAVELAQAAGPTCELVIFDGADHCGGYFEDRQGYIDRVARFLQP
jgi:alpha-beta hydrolase superfamily lysophospholipase